MDVDNIMLVSFRTLCFIGIIYASITLYNADWLFVDIPAGEDVFVDFECSSLLENDLTTDWYYQQCLSDKEGAQQTMYDHIVLLFRAIQAISVLAVCGSAGMTLFLIHFIKLLYKTDWVTATFKFRFGKIDAEHARNVYKNYPRTK